MLCLLIASLPARPYVELTPGFTLTEIARELNSPTAMAVAPDGRIFVCQQGGEIRILRDDSLLPVPFLTVPTWVDDEQGLMGIALDPDFARNGRFFVNVGSANPHPHNQIRRYTAHGDTADPASDTLLFELDVPGEEFHLGGGLLMGPDGCLYIGSGESGYPERVQAIDNSYGKILRINRDGSIPADNPFFRSAKGKARAIYASGFRAAFTLVSQPGSKRLFALDVGNEAVEEVDELIPGGDYGWPKWEGPGLAGSKEISPLFSYLHGPNHGQGSSITGGVFYPSSLPGSSPGKSAGFPEFYRSKMFIADYTVGWIRALDPLRPDSAAYFADHLSAPVALALSPKGSLYCLLRGKSTMDGGTGLGWNVGSLVRFDYGPSLATEIVRQPESVRASLGEACSFRISASGKAPIAYQWQRKARGEGRFADIPGATGAELALSALTPIADGSAYRCRVKAGLGELLSREAALEVTRDARPSAYIDSPRAGFQYEAGTTISFSGRGLDPEDGVTMPDRLFWQVEHHIDGHAHPVPLASVTGTGGSFRIPDSGETASRAFYRILLRVEDKAGLSRSASVDLQPKRIRMRFRTDPPEIILRINNEPFITPGAYNAIPGQKLYLSADSLQWIDRAPFFFASWSDGNPLSHAVVARAGEETRELRFKPKSIFRKLRERTARVLNL
jgi:glucose/arabinose dehydrogenase